MFNDTSINGLTDIMKRNSGMAEKLFAAIGNDDAFDFAGIRFKQTTTAPSSTIGGNTYYNTYVYGDDALFSIFLGKAPDGDKNYKLFIQSAPENGSVSDPARQIGGFLQAA